MGSYRVGQVCLNGDPVTDNVASGHGADHCGQCGTETISECLSCKAPIRGKYQADGVISISKWYPQAHCYSCGAPYPWTQAKLDAINELADAIEELTDFERGELAELMPHLIQETPRTKPAGFKVATILARMKGPGKAALRDLMNDIVVEAGKTAMGF